MAKIIKIGSMNTTLTSKTANLAKTSRQGNITNPFKFSNFEGNTLQFADVFEGFEPKKQNKLRMIATSVTGSMSKMRTSIKESIVNFVDRVRGAWDYAKNTNMSDLPGIKQVKEYPAIKQINDIMTKPIELNMGINIDSLKESKIGKSISSGIEIMTTEHHWSDVWSALISKVHTKPTYTNDMPVSDLELAWKNINANESLEVAA